MEKETKRIGGWIKKTNQYQELQEEIESLHNELADYQFNYPTIKELQEEIARLKKENDRLRKEAEENQDLATIAYMQGAGEY